MKNKLTIAALSVALLLCVFTTQAQEFPPLDKSPADIAYYPVDASKKKDVDPVARVIYSRPSANDRTIFGDVVPYENVWRLGANENAELKLFKDVRIADKRVAAGTYSLFAIPGQTKWTIILNKATDAWGAYSYDKGKDAVRVEVERMDTPQTIDAFTIFFEDVDEGGHMIIAWSDTMVRVPIK